MTLRATSYFNTDTVEYEIADAIEFSRRANEDDIELVKRLATFVDRNHHDHDHDIDMTVCVCDCDACTNCST